MLLEKLFSMHCSFTLLPVPDLGVAGTLNSARGRLRGGEEGIRSNSGYSTPYPVTGTAVTVLGAISVSFSTLLRAQRHPLFLM